MSQQQRSYLLRPQKEKQGDFFSWFSCCNGYQNIPFNQEVRIEKPVLTLKKPVKQRLTKTGYENIGSSKQNTVKGERGNKTDRKQEAIQQIQFMRLSQFQSPRNMENRNSYQPNSAIRFSYGMPPQTVSSRHKQNVISDYFGNYSAANSNKLEHISIKDQSEESKNSSKLHRRFQAPKSINIPPAIRQSPPLSKNINNNNDPKSPKPKEMEFEAEPRSAKSAKKLKKVKSKQVGRLSLKIRQVVSIREPQEDSDHESIVIEQSDDSLLGKLKPIHQNDHQSNPDGHYKDSFL